jgi:hypothetical protein
MMRSAFLLTISLLASGQSASAQRASDIPPHADTTGESDVYPVGDAVGVYHAILDLLYVDGKERPGVIVLWDTAQRQSGGPCSWRCVEPWPHKSEIDTATILAYTQQSWKRPRIVKFGYRKIPIVLVSDGDMERITQEGYGYLAHQPADKVGQAEAHWEGFRRKYPTAWGRVMLGKVGFNPKHTEALIGVYQSCGFNCGSFETVFLRRVGKQWRVIERVPEDVRREAMSGNLRYRGPAVARKHESEIVAIDALGSPPRSEADDAAKIYVVVLDSLYSSFGQNPRQIVVATTRAAYESRGLPAHRSKVDSITIGMYDAYLDIRDALYPRFKHRIPVAWISDTTLRVMQGEPPGEPMFRMSEGQSREMWATFRSKYPGAWGYARLGRVGFNPQHTQALVLTQHYCGEMCVNTDTWLAERKNESWYIVERMPRHSEKGYPMDGLRYLGADADPKWFRPRRVRAQFTDAATGKTLAGHDVEFFPADGESKFVKTDAGGWYVLEKPPLTAYIMKVKCPATSLTDWAFAGGLAITPGIDTTLNVRVNFGECIPPPAEPELAPNAPPDQPVEATRECIWRAIDRDMQPYIAQARATWPQARKRYLAGLPPRHSFFVTALLVDDTGRREQVFIAVERIRDGQITGRIWNRVEVVRGYQHGQRYTFPESELRDWMIAKPDGTEEGNFVGKFLDGYEAPGGCESDSESD